MKWPDKGERWLDKSEGARQGRTVARQERGRVARPTKGVRQAQESWGPERARWPPPGKGESEKEAKVKRIVRFLCDLDVLE